MDQEQQLEIIEQLAKEKQDVMNSPAYQKGAAILRYVNRLKKRDWKGLQKDLRDNKAAKIIRKEYLSHVDRLEADVNDLDITKPEIVIYTCVLNGYDDIPKPLLKFDNLHYVLLTDDPGHYNHLADTFEIKKLPDAILEKGPVQANRYVKFHPKEMFPEADYAIYMDGNVRPMADWRAFIKRLPDQTGIAMHNHRERDDAYSEAEVCKLLRRGDPDKIDKQMQRYRNAGFPAHYGMNEATVIVSDLHNETAVMLLDSWWKEFVKSESGRDQLAWPFVLFENDILIEEIGNLGNDIYKNPKVEMSRHV